MVIWRVLANEICNGCGAVFCETKAEAERVLREHVRFCKENGQEPGVVAGPEKMVINNRVELCRALNDAMGYGAT